MPANGILDSGEAGKGQLAGKGTPSTALALLCHAPTPLAPEVSGLFCILSSPDSCHACPPPRATSLLHLSPKLHAPSPTLAHPGWACVHTCPHLSCMHAFHAPCPALHPRCQSHGGVSAGTQHTACHTHARSPSMTPATPWDTRAPDWHMAAGTQPNTMCHGGRHSRHPTSHTHPPHTVTQLLRPLRTGAHNEKCTGPQSPK